MDKIFFGRKVNRKNLVDSESFMSNFQFYFYKNKFEPGFWYSERHISHVLADIRPKFFVFQNFVENSGLIFYVLK